jgi:single-strand DNA-binding protein
MINASVRGNVGNVDLKYLPDGKPVLEFSLASNDRGKGGAEVTTWVRCAVFGPRAEALAKVIDKGASLMVVGPLSVREFESQGAKRFSVEVKVDQLDFCGGGKGKSDGPNPSSGARGAPAGGGYGAGRGGPPAGTSDNEGGGEGDFPY